MKHYDVIVLGLGGMGSAALAHLSKRKHKVLGLEQFSPAHTLGSSHGQSRIIRKAYFEDPAYVPLIMRAYELWSELEQATGRSLFLRTGGLMAGHAEAAVVQGSLRSAREHGLPHELLDAADIRRRFPVTRVRDGEVALYETEAGVLFSEECIMAHLQAAVAAGAEARFGTRVQGWAPTAEGGVRVQTSDGEVFADKLVIAAGAWLGVMAPELGLPLQVERNNVYWFAPSDGVQGYGADRFPIYILERKDEPVLFGFPILPGQDAAKHGIHHTRDFTTADTIDREVAPAEVETMRRWLAGWLPGLDRVQKASVCMYTNTPDEHFVLGLHPQHQQVVLAGGFSGHGFKFCSVVGEVLADLATAGHTRHPIAFCSPTRFVR